MTPGKRYRIKSPAGVTVYCGHSPEAPVIHHLPCGTIILCAQVRDDASGATRIRISSPAGWISETELEETEPLGPERPDYQAFLENHLDVAPGEFYEFDFPFTLDLLQEFGPEFLTKAFRASGYISQDNRVTEIVELESFDLKGASVNAFMTVAYEKDEPGITTQMFIKAPRTDLDYKYFNYVGVMGEVHMAHFSQRDDFPVTTARCCYTDYNARTMNYLLITERVPFGVGSVPPAYRKGYDHTIADIEEHYRVRAKAQARLIHAFKSGEMGYDVEDHFPFARSARKFEPIPDVEAKVDKLIDFVQRVAPRVFPAEVTTPEFLAMWREDLLFGLQNGDAVVNYLHNDIDYTGLCHYNLTIDNAWYWRDDVGDLQVGLLDWGGAGQMSIGQALSGMVMMLEPEKHLAITRELISTFVTEYARLGGPQLDEKELRLHYKASLFSTAICSIVTLILNVIDQVPEEKFSAMESWRDGWLQESGLAPVILWIDNMLREWLDDITPGDACRIIVEKVEGRSLAAVA